jgi:hypothetical protein
MRLAVIVVSMITVASSTASAAGRATDVDYLRASRCRGIAAGLAADTASLDAFLKTEGRTRDMFVLQRGEEEQARGKRDARRTEAGVRATAELNGPCQAYKG